MIKVSNNNLSGDSICVFVFDQGDSIFEDGKTDDADPGDADEPNCAVSGAEEHVGVHRRVSSVLSNVRISSEKRTRYSENIRVEHTDVFQKKVINICGSMKSRKISRKGSQFLDFFFWILILKFFNTVSCDPLFPTFQYTPTHFAAASYPQWDGCISRRDEKRKKMF